MRLANLTILYLLHSNSPIIVLHDARWPAKAYSSQSCKAVYGQGVVIHSEGPCSYAAP